jgi:hypothetical protein
MWNIISVDQSTGLFCDSRLVGFLGCDQAEAVGIVKKLNAAEQIFIQYEPWIRARAEWIACDEANQDDWAKKILRTTDYGQEFFALLDALYRDLTGNAGSGE